MKIGDRVRFLNAVGGGTVTQIRDRGVVLVEDEDGFEVPVLARECVVIDVPKLAELSLASQTLKEAVNKRHSPLPILPQEESLTGNKITAYLAFVAQNIKQLSQSVIECYLINDSNYYLHYTLSVGDADGCWKLWEKGDIEPNLKVLLNEVAREDLNGLEQIFVQAIAYKEEKSFEVKRPISVKLRVDTTKFYKLHSFRENDYFDAPAILFPLVVSDQEVKPEVVPPLKFSEIKESIHQRNPQTHSPAKRNTSSKQFRKGAVLEIDLHIDELIDNLIGLSPADMLTYQLEKFEEVMQEYKKVKGQKIVFIHGKGNGVLRKELILRLKKNFPNSLAQDASFREYGFGATLVTIK